MSIVVALWSPIAGRAILGVGAGFAGMLMLNGSWQLAYLTPLPFAARRTLRVALPMAGAASAVVWSGAPLLFLGISRLVSSSAFGTRQLRARATSFPALVAMVGAAGLEIAASL
ncbi:MAG: hypothetical protein HYU52_09890, partial [Acidobacteria bacterium]|nr:hypothetical protein [Acidobacteriota bacterium]